MVTSKTIVEIIDGEFPLPSSLITNVYAKDCYVQAKTPSMSDVTIAVLVDGGFDHHRAVPASLRTEWWDTNGFGNIRGR